MPFVRPPSSPCGIVPVSNRDEGSCGIRESPRAGRENLLSRSRTRSGTVTPGTRREMVGRIQEALDGVFR